MYPVQELWNMSLLGSCYWGEQPLLALASKGVVMSLLVTTGIQRCGVVDELVDGGIDMDPRDDCLPHAVYPRDGCLPLIAPWTRLF